MSAVKNLLRRHQRRMQERKGFYRSAASALQGRIRKKLMDKTHLVQTKRRGTGGRGTRPGSADEERKE